MRQIIETAPGAGLTAEIETVGERPAGRREVSDPIVQCAADALRWAGAEPTFHTSSTDANIPISLGIPSVCLGFCETARGHTVEEASDLTSLAPSLAVLTRTVCDTASIVAGANDTPMR